MSIIDTHCHYNLHPLVTNWQTHWQTAQDHGVTAAVVVGTTIETSRRAVEIATSDTRLKAAVGVHPTEYNHVSTADLPTLLTAQRSVLHQLIDQSSGAPHPQIVAIGETGLDYFRISEPDLTTAKHRQRHALRMHLELANAHHLPVLLHVRDQGEAAYWDVLELLQTVYRWHRPVILHCVSGPTAYVHAAIKLGAYIGVAANCTYPNAQALRDIIASVPHDRLVVETDAPYLPPQSHRGTTCEPWMIAQTVEYLHTQLGVNVEQLHTNTLSIFGYNIAA